MPAAFFHSSIDAPRSIFRLIRITAIPLAIVIAAPDLGTGSIIAALSIGLYWLAGGSVRSLAAAGALLSAGIAAVLLVTPYQQARIGAWLDPSADPRGASYQILRAREVFKQKLTEDMWLTHVRAVYGQAVASTVSS